MRVHHLLRFEILPFVVAAIAFEIVWYLAARRRSYPWREMLASVGVSVLRLSSKLVRPLAVLPIIWYAWSYRLSTIPLNSAWAWAALFLGADFTYYWMHRCSHEVRWLWATHVVHHTAQRLHLASAYRLGVTGVLSGGWLFYFPLYLIGFNPMAVAGMLAANLFYQFWLHTELIGKLGPFEWIFNTPSHHRVHHASNEQYVDRNYGGILIIWDRLFGTFANERADTPIVYGLVRPFASLNPFVLAFHEWFAVARDLRECKSCRESLRQLFGRPGESLTAQATAR